MGMARSTYYDRSQARLDDTAGYDRELGDRLIRRRPWYRRW